MRTNGIFIYPWDLIDNGLDRTAAQLQDMGISFISIAAVYHQAKMLLPHNRRRRVFMHPSSRSYFPFHRAAYARLAPMRGELLDSYDGRFWDEMLDCFSRRDIQVCAWVVVFHSSRLAGSHSDCAIHNYMGEPSSSSLCPSHPEVFEYGLQLLEDISATGVDEIHLESVDYAGFLHGDHHEMQAFSDTAAVNRLLGFCFCPNCLDRAEHRGIPSHAFQKQVRRQAELFFRSGITSGEDIDLQDRYEEMRCQRIAEFYQELKNRLSQQGLRTKIKPILWLSGGSDPMQYGVNTRLYAESVDGVIAAYPDNPAEIPGFLVRTFRLLPDGFPVTGGVRLMAPQTVCPGQVREYINAYAEQGISQLIFYNYGMAPAPFLGEIRGA